MAQGLPLSCLASSFPFPFLLLLLPQAQSPYIAQAILEPPASASTKLGLATDTIKPDSTSIFKQLTLR